MGPIVYGLFRLTILVTRPLPLWLGYRIAAVVAGVCYFFFIPQRRALNDNLSHVLKDESRREVDAVARRAFGNFGKFVIDFIHSPALTRDEVRQRLVFSQWDEIEEAARSGKGILIVTMHFGVFDLGAASLASHDYPTSLIGENFGYKKMDELIHGSREKLGVRVLPSDKAAVSAFRTLKRGGILALLIDVAPPGQTVTVDFFGAPALVSSAPARLALRTGAWVVPSMVLRGPERDTTITPILDFRSVRYDPTGDEERDVRELTQQMMRAFEPTVRAHPEQWFIFRRLWDAKGPAHAPEGVSSAH